MCAEQAARRRGPPTWEEAVGQLEWSEAALQALDRDTPAGEVALGLSRGSDSDVT